MDAPSAVDAAIIERFRAANGSQRGAVFEEIFTKYHSQVYGLCLRLCANRALAEDALQEAFLEVYKSLRAFRGESQLGTWIYRVTMRTALRLHARHPAPVEFDVEVDVAANNPHDTLAAREQARAVQAALDALPAEQRVVVALFSSDGLTHGEIAAILGIPEGTVWSRLHKARKVLAATLKEPARENKQP